MSDHVAHAAWNEAEAAKAKTPFDKRFWQNLRWLIENATGEYDIWRSGIFKDDGPHPAGFVELECGFAAQALAKIRPKTVLDVGSYTQFVIGLSANYEVTAIDVRGRAPLGSERIMVCDAKQLPFDDGAFDVVLSLCTLEHIGLGRYGDEFDPTGDSKAFSEMRRVLKPDGDLVFTTYMKTGRMLMYFNVHRVYSRAAIHAFCDGLTLVEERLITPETVGARYCAESEIPKIGGINSAMYCGWWHKS